MVSACADAPEGLRRTPEGGGPLVIFDLDHKPLPEIPFPNDLATRADATAATGLRVNASMIAPTVLEHKVRSKIDRLDGFGTQQTIWVAFDMPLDIDNLLARHRDNLDFSDDAVYLVNIDPHSPGFGEQVLLDIGRGNYPLTTDEQNVYFDADPRGHVYNVLFDTVEEDLNENGVLDPGEDSDDDGVLDHPNVWPPGEDPQDGLMTFYESETNTLLLAPVVPLRQRTTYAVVLTDRLIGFAGRPVRSPFPWVHHLNQTGELKRLDDVGIDIDEVAFAWTFTTQSVTADLVAIREGLYGQGPLGWLQDDFRVDVKPERCMSREEEEVDSYYTLEASRLLGVLESIGPEVLGEYMDIAGPIIDTFDYVDYFTAGSFSSPDFNHTGEYGLDPENYHRENFNIDLHSGTADVKPAKLYFVMAIPKETPFYKPPYPVVIYCHSYSSLRAEGLGFAGVMARLGMATAAIDAWGHGMPTDPTLEELIVSAGNAYGFKPFAEKLLEGRARDLTGDGAKNSGGDFWTGYGFHTRDAVRQGVADHLQFVRVLRSFDGQRTWRLDQDEDGQPDLAGDFDGDGRVDAGGSDVDYFVWGQSGGGIHSSIIGPLEPHIIAAAPTAGGGRLADVGMRTMLGGVKRALMLRTMGPLVIGRPEGESLRIRLHVPLSTDEIELPVGSVEGVEAGDTVVVLNLAKNEEHVALVHDGPRFRVSLEADAGDSFRVTFYDASGAEIDRLEHWPEDVWFWELDEPTFLKGEELKTPTEGFGLARCTPALRRMVSLFQMIIDPADPANYATHYFKNPLDIRPEGKTITNILELACLGDQDVPINTQATMGRAAGVIEHLVEQERLDGMTPNDWLISHYVYEGLARLKRFEGYGRVNFDPDDVDEGRDGFDVPAPPPEKRLRLKVKTDTGESGVRFAQMTPEGQHGVFPTGEEEGFSTFMYFANQVAHFFASGGTEILDDLCLENASCPAP
jgi:hypothetical protein